MWLSRLGLGERRGEYDLSLDLVRDRPILGRGEREGEREELYRRCCGGLRSMGLDPSSDGLYLRLFMLGVELPLRLRRPRFSSSPGISRPLRLLFIFSQNVRDHP
jgi:hypothetical protein